MQRQEPIRCTCALVFIEFQKTNTDLLDGMVNSRFLHSNKTFNFKTSKDMSVFPYLNTPMITFKT